MKWWFAGKRKKNQKILSRRPLGKYCD